MWYTDVCNHTWGFFDGLKRVFICFNNNTCIRGWKKYFCLIKYTLYNLSVHCNKTWSVLFFFFLVNQSLFICVRGYQTSQVLNFSLWMWQSDFTCCLFCVCDMNLSDRVRLSYLENHQLFKNRQSRCTFLTDLCQNLGLLSPVVWELYTRYLNIFVYIPYEVCIYNFTAAIKGLKLHLFHFFSLKML